MEEVFKRCYCCFVASFDPQCRLPRRAINSLEPQRHKDFIYCNVSHRDYCCILLCIQLGERLFIRKETIPRESSINKG